MTSTSSLFGLVRAHLGRQLCARSIAPGSQRCFSGDRGDITSIRQCLSVLKAPDRINHRPALEWLTEDVDRMATLGPTDAGLVIARAVSAGKWDTATQVLKHHGSKRILFRSVDWLVSQCCREGQPRVAMSLLVKMAAQGKVAGFGTHLYPITIKALLADGDATAAASLIEAVLSSDPSIVLDENFCFQAISVYMRLKRWQEAVDVLQRATENGKRVLERGGCYEATARACAAGGEIGLARELVHNCVRLGFAPRIPTYNAILGACARGKQPEVAMEVLAEMRGRNIEPDEISYGALMEASATVGARGGEQWARSLELLNEMLEREVLPTNSFVSALVEICFRAGKLEELPGLIEHMEVHGVQIKEAMYARAMHALAKAGSWRECLSLLSRMYGRRLSVGQTHYEAALQSCVAAGQWAKALALGEQMKAKGVRRSQACMAKILDACMQGQRWDEALAVLRTMRQQGGATPSAYRSVLRLAGKLGRVEEAKALIREAQVDGIILTAASLRGAVIACRKNGQWMEALQLVDRKGVEGKGEGADLAACRGVALEACIMAGRGDVAVTKLREWEGNGWALDEACYAAAIAGCAQAEDWEEAMRLLACVRRLPEPVGDAAVYQNVMYACVRGGRHDDVVAIFHGMVEDGVAPNARCYMSLLNSLKAKGDWEGALRHVRTGLRCGAISAALGHTALAMVAGVCLHHGRWREAFELVTLGQQKYGFKSQLKGHNCAKALDYLATRTPQPASWQEMLEFLQAWRHVTGTSPGIRNANKLLERIAQEGEWGAALDMLRHGMIEHLGVSPDAASFATLMKATDRYDPTQPSDGDLEASASGDGPRTQPPRPEAMLRLMGQMGLAPDAICYTVALTAMQRSGDSAAALSLFDSMRQDHTTPPGVYSYGAVLGILAELHDWGKIVELVQEMDDRGMTPTGVAYVNMAQKCLQARQWPIVSTLLRHMRRHNAEPSDMYHQDALRALRDDGAVAEVCDLLREMQDEGAVMQPAYFRIALQACGVQGHWREALELVDRMGQAGLPLTMSVVAPAIQACMHGGAAQEAYALLQGVMGTDEWHTTADEAQKRRCTNDVLRSLAAAKQWQTAVEVLEQMEQGVQGFPLPDRESYGAVMQACVNSLRREEAGRIRQRMTDNLREEEGADEPDNHRAFATPTAEPDVVTRAEPEAEAAGLERELAEISQAAEAEAEVVMHEAEIDLVMGEEELRDAVDGLLQRRDWPQLIGLLGRARRGFVQVPQSMYADVLGVLRRAGAWLHACQVVRDAQASHAALTPACYHLALDSCSQHGRWEEALDLLESMGRSGLPPTVTAFALTMVSCSRGGAPGLCADLLQRAVASEEWGVTPVGKEREEEARRRKCCNAALLGMAAAGMWEPAVEVLGHMVEKRGGYPSPNPATFQAVAEACGAAGEVEERQRIEAWMHDRFGEIRPPGKRSDRMGQEAGGASGEARRVISTQT